MRLPQAAGFAMTIAVVILADLPLDWLIVAATFAGALTTLVVEVGVGRRR